MSGTYTGSTTSSLSGSYIGSPLYLWMAITLVPPRHISPSKFYTIISLRAHHPRVAWSATMGEGVPATALLSPPTSTLLHR
jgi:hypothetical protein